MKALTSLLFLWSSAMVACAVPDPPNEVQASNTTSCDTIVQFASERFCLPLVDGWKEGINHPRLQNRRGAFVDSANTTFGIYLSERTWAMGDDLERAVLDDYFKVYATKGAEKFKVRTDQLSLLTKEFTGATMRAQWSDVEAYLEGKYSDVNLGQPVLMESYQPKTGVSTIVYLMRSELQGKEMFTLMTLSLCVVKERCLLVAHYLEYNGRQSVSAAKSKSDYFVLRLLAEND